MEVSGGPERRRVRRRRVFKGARISFRGLRAAIDCTVHDFSEQGARLIVESPVGIPDRFDLVINGGPARFCCVVWRKATQIGVAFIRGSRPDGGPAGHEAGLAPGPVEDQWPVG